MPAFNLNLFAKWQHSINFETNGGSIVLPIIQDSGTLLVAPNDPAKEGYTFSGWYSDEALTTIYMFTTMPDQNITLYAKWQNTISFETNGGSDVATITQDSGIEVSAPSVPTTEGYTFSGWYSEETFVTIYTFTNMPSQNITLYAKWTINKYSIIFYENNGSLVDDITQDYETLITYPSILRSGYTFDGWYLDNGTFKFLYDSQSIEAENVSLYAKWVLTLYTINYYMSDGINHSDNPSNYTMLSANFILKSAFRTGYTFSGWYESSDFSTARVYSISTSRVENFSLMMFIVGLGFLIAMLSVVPIHRANIRSQYLKYEEMKASVENMSQIEGYEKASIYRDVIQMNTNIEQAKYYARSKWTNWFFDPIIFEMTPIRVEK
jgi:uncharacterized repeat protein (TIGR02543 family)